MIPVALPENVTVNLKSKQTISGVRLIEINARQQQIKIEQGTNTNRETKKIADIESLVFSGRVKLKGGKIVIRGEINSSCSNTENWNLPLNNITFKDSSQAEFPLSSLPKDKRQDIEQIKPYRTFVVDQMRFENQGKVTLKITPCSEK